MQKIENTQLWKKTLGSSEKEYKDEIEFLRTEFKTFRERAGQLVSLINKTLPDLTIHDITHLDALWEVADTICGSEFSLNPLEAFIFGGAILLHDSALCVEAYEGGLEGIKSTNQWKDAHSMLTSSGSTLNPEDALKEANFAAIRALHASRAEELADSVWSLNGNSLTLISNTDLRVSLGRLIGKIASSHHWNIEKVKDELPEIIGPPAAFPSNWSISPRKIACMLRCADAAHISSERAPNFLMALRKRSGISFDHWNAQNKMASAVIDSTGEKLLFTANQSFSQNEEQSWWVIYDALLMIDQEIKTSNSLLKSINSEEFSIKGVANCSSPEEVNKNIPTENWTPLNKEIHVSNLQHLITQLGGSNLYGKGRDELEVVIRELLQNSRDAILARMSFDEGFSDGKITIEIKRDTDGTWLVISDNGIGMSERVLTGPLLDFGTSFWSSDLVLSEFPGLKSSPFKPLGQFGIGFYSIFMVAKKVHVSSKRWDSGLDETLSLSFNNGLSLRPLFQKGRASGVSSNNTQVRLLLKDSYGSLDSHNIRHSVQGFEDFTVNNEAYLSALCAGLTVNVYFKDTEQTKLIHRKDFFDHAEEWLKKIAFYDFRPADEKSLILETIEKESNRMEKIIDPNTGALEGFAAITTSLYKLPHFINARTVGGLMPTIHSRTSDNFIGFIDNEPDSARRNIGNNQQYSMGYKAWLESQLKRLESQEWTYEDRLALSHSLCDLGADPSDTGMVAMVSHSDKDNILVIGIDELLNIAINQKLVLLNDTGFNQICSDKSFELTNREFLIFPVKSSSFYNIKSLSSSPNKTHSLLDILRNKAKERGLELNLEFQDTPHKNKMTGSIIKKGTISLSPIGE
ncbi:ATP-binding protein [Paraferrimonas sp. SM1919]|uniref:HD domain-containing protein n=1 Tax=Paraferrimonas sp. SM1919 TaxID=2662263 RepID=UPI0013D2F9ED|nr:ATP-binding protein [Paraferrimonas sp. SM1919]